VRTGHLPDTRGRGPLRFGEFELNLRACELRRRGRAVRLERLPMNLLIMLVERPGDLVTRAEIVDRLWGKDVFVDVETGVHTAIRKIRQALRDSADAPAFVETVQGRGYRFIAQVELVASVGGPAVTLAVLPFEDLGGDPERRYLADGLTEETIASLGQMDPERVAVIGRQSMMVYKGNATKSLAQIGREVGADYLLESSLRAENGRFRIVTKLIRAHDQVQVWCESYDREPASILGLQVELSAAIAQQIHLRLAPERLDVLARRQTRNADAYDLYLRGRNYENQRTSATTLKAIEYFERATGLDPDYALAWTGLAEACAASPINSDAPPLEVWPRAREAAAHALRSAPNLADAQFAMAYVNWRFEWDWTAAESGFRRATALDPSHAISHLMLGHLLSQTGRHDLARSSMRRARELDPLSPMSHAMSSQVEFQARNYPAALEHARRAIALDPEFWIGYMTQAQALDRMNLAVPSIESLVQAGRFSNQNSKAVSLRGYVLARAGRLDEAREVLETLEAVARDRYVPPYALALVHAGFGEREAVYEWLERAHAARDVHLMFLPVDAKWDDYRQDVRFNALLSRCGVPR
jgi:TolB-like protein/Flp pilus assembly protein TadD